MISVPALLVLIYYYGPMFGVVMAFQKFEPALGFLRSKFVGLGNFERLFKLPDIWEVVRNTLFIASMKIIVETIAAILVAILLNEIQRKKFKRTVQTIIYAPYFLSWVILGGIFRDILAADGLVNNLLTAVGMESYNFLGQPKTFPWVLILTETWQLTGFNAIVYLAAIANIDPNLYEAAAIDGAGRLKQTWYVTIPGMSSYIVVMLILNLGYILNAGLDQILMLYSSVVYSTGDVIDTWVYRAGLQNAQYSLASAVGLLRSIVSLIMVAGSYYIAYKKFDYRVF
ncbi:MAG TPA: sugar ABC transporter permease [Clostridiales bacterium]|nr:sugar ABC transporter permease [Clostridiales bacterium]